MDGKRNPYLAYMLRMWRAFTERGPAWRASLEDPQTGERRGFADLKELIEFLRARTDGEPDPAGPPGGSPPDG